MPIQVLPLLIVCVAVSKGFTAGVVTGITDPGDSGATVAVLLILLIPDAVVGSFVLIFLNPVVVFAEKSAAVAVNLLWFSLLWMSVKLFQLLPHKLG